jgi:hypothetical protein
MSVNSKFSVRLILSLVLLKLCYLATLSGVLLLWDDFNTQNFLTMARWPHEGPPLFASHFATWDAAHYLYLSEEGYQPNLPSCAFYPLWPLLVRWASTLFGIGYLLTGTILANVLSLIAWVLFHRLVADRWGETSANWGLVMLIAFPGSLFFQFNYSESLFLVLTLVLWAGLNRGLFRSTWLAASLLPLTRGPGVFAVLPIIWHALEPTRPALTRFVKLLRFTWSVGHRDIAARRVTQDTLCLQSVLSRSWLLWAPILGWSLYVTLMWEWTGNPLEGIQAQRYWGVHSISNLWNVPKFVVGLLTPTAWHEFRGSALDRCVFILLLFCLPVLWRLQKELLVWIYILGVLPAMSGTFTSFTRFASCAFPLFIALGVFLAKRERLFPRYALLTVFVLLHLLLLWRFANFRWAG